MIYYNGGNAQMSTQNSLTDKALLIKYFVILALSGLCYFPMLVAGCGTTVDDYAQPL